MLFALCILLCGLPHWWTREGDSSALPQLSFSEAASGSSEAVWLQRSEEGTPSNVGAIRLQPAGQKASLADYTAFLPG